MLHCQPPSSLRRTASAPQSSQGLRLALRAPDALAQTSNVNTLLTLRGAGVVVGADLRVVAAGVGFAGRDVRACAPVTAGRPAPPRCAGPVAARLLACAAIDDLGRTQAFAVALAHVESSAEAAVGLAHLVLALTGVADVVDAAGKPLPAQAGNRAVICPKPSDRSARRSSQRKAGHHRSATVRLQAAGTSRRARRTGRALV